jgi:hypothetical protein
MGFKVKIQEVVRAKSKSYYINFPVAFAEAIEIEKGEEVEWFIENRNTYVLKRIVKRHTELKNKAKK